MRNLIIAVLAIALSSCGDGQSSDGVFPENAPGVIGKVASASSGEPEATEAQRAMFGTLVDNVGRSFKGMPTGDATEQFVDIQKWEWGLGGNTILIRHALADGSYGGDTHVYQDAKTNKLTYVYVTSGGFHTVGEMVPTDNGWVAEEAVSGHENITRVRSTSVVNSAGIWKMTSEYLTDGEWVRGHAFDYAETNDPLPALKVE